MEIVAGERTSELSGRVRTAREETRTVRGPTSEELGTAMAVRCAHTVEEGQREGVNEGVSAGVEPSQEKRYKRGQQRREGREIEQAK